MPFILFALSGGRIPLALTVMQILAIDLGTDLVPALALGAEPPEPGVMDRPPRRLSEHVITRALLVRAYAWLGIIQSLAAMSAFYHCTGRMAIGAGGSIFPADGPLYRAATAMTLAAVVATQIGNLLRSAPSLCQCFGCAGAGIAWCGSVIATELALLALLLYVPVLQRPFDQRPSPAELALFMAWTPILLLADEGRKALVRRRARGRVHSRRGLSV